MPGRREGLWEAGGCDRRRKQIKKGSVRLAGRLGGNGQGKRCSGLVSAWIRVGGQRLWMKRMRGELCLAAG